MAFIASSAGIFKKAKKKFRGGLDKKRAIFY